jgi:hypothetical protein
MCDRIPAQAREILEAIQEAIDIPHAASAGDEAVRAEILEDRLLQVVTFLHGLLDYQRPDVAWNIAYLREQLAKHPAEGYRTDYASVLAGLKAAQDGAR